jgi:hypothetical protein
MLSHQSIFYCVMGWICFIASTWQPIFAGIHSTSSNTVHAVQGDAVGFVVNGTNLMNLDWFFDGKVTTRGRSYTTQTRTRDIGVYVIDLVAQTSHNIEVVRFHLHISKAPPLYQPKKIHPILSKPESLTKISKDTPWILSTKGQLEFKSVQKPTSKWTPSTTFSQLQPGQIFRIGHSNRALIGGIDNGDQLHLVGPNEFETLKEGLRLRQGFTVLRRFSSLQGQSDIELADRVQLRSLGAGDIIVNLRSIDDRTVADLIAIGSNIDLTCFGKRISVKTPLFVTIDIDPTTKTCDRQTLKDTSQLQSILKLTKETQPLWRKSRDTDFLKLFRMEYSSDLTTTNLDRYRGGIAGAFERRDWTAVFDLYGLMFYDADPKPSQVMMIGKSYIEMGYFSEGIAILKDLDEVDTNNPDVAFEIGRAYELKEDHAQAQTWFELAREWNYNDKAKIHRFIANSSLNQHLDRDAARNFEMAYRHHLNDNEASESFYLSRQTLRDRDWIANINTGLWTTANTLPADLEKQDLAVFNIAPTTNRSLALLFEGDWARTLEKGPKLDVELYGMHSGFHPFESTLWQASAGSHEVGGRFDVKHSSINTNAKIATGTKLSGMDRQLDLYKGSLGATWPRSQALAYSGGLYSIRAFDPQPGGADIVDLRLARITSESDHSYFEVGFEASMERPGVLEWWETHLSYGFIDFRKAPLSHDDATELKLQGLYGKRLNRIWMTEGLVRLRQLDLKTSGSDSTLSIKARGGWMFLPLWSTKLELEYISRAAESESVRYSGLNYGLSLTATF